MEKRQSSLNRFTQLVDGRSNIHPNNSTKPTENHIQLMRVLNLWDPNFSRLSSQIKERFNKEGIQLSFERMLYMALLASSRICPIIKTTEALPIFNGMQEFQRRLPTVARLYIKRTKPIDPETKTFVEYELVRRKGNPIPEIFMCTSGIKLDNEISAADINKALSEVIKRHPDQARLGSNMELSLSGQFDGLEYKSYVSLFKDDYWEGQETLLRLDQNINSNHIRDLNDRLLRYKTLYSGKYSISFRDSH